MCIFPSHVVKAAPGDLDTSFGTNGIVKYDIDNDVNTVDRGTGVVIDDNKKIVVSAIADQDGANANFAILRFNADGTPDTSFNNGSEKLIIDIGGNLKRDWANAIAIDSQGRIVVAGTYNQGHSDSDVAVVRFDPANNTIDETFFGFGSNTREEIYAVAIDANDNIVLAGKTHDNDAFKGPDSNFFL